MPAVASKFGEECPLIPEMVIGCARADACTPGDTAERQPLDPGLEQDLKSRLELVPTADGLEVSATIEPGSFDSGNFIRDGNARFGLFDANRFPTASLSGTLPLAPEMLQPGAVSRTQETVLSGHLSLHGLTQALMTPVTVSREGSRLSAKTTFPVALSAFGMEGPSLLGVTVTDEVRVSVSLEGDVTAP